MHLDISEPRRLAHIADTGSTFATRSRSRGRCMRAQFSGSTGRNPSGRGLENVCSFFFCCFVGGIDMLLIHFTRSMVIYSISSQGLLIVP